ncbi:hypothetical protein PCANC_28639 [Puccinia coronata f. sp. avenae]|uniref:Uncharacterized protein n=1 Tax=Puccinia coronata f. sp. avenae TaxID=200324 RepID=A0A2N5S5K8_9BASI|nr:hypothetical protein PCANC_28639 [Puccinia coronata f. sp. avenae]
MVRNCFFEQQRAAERAAELETERARQQQKLAETSGRQSAFEHPSSTYQHSPNELPSSVNHSCSFEQASAVIDSSAPKFVVPPNSLSVLATAPTKAPTQLATGAQPEGILPLATPSAPQLLRDCVAPESYNTMLTVLDKIKQLEMEMSYPPATA